MTRSSQSDSPIEATALKAAQTWLNQGDVALSPAPDTEEAVEEQRFLRFALSAAATEASAEVDAALLPLESIQEVSQIPQRGVLAVPDVPDAVLGIANCRGAILWLVDLIKLLGLPDEGHSSIGSSTGFSGMESFTGSTIPSFHTLTIHAAGQSIGLVVPRVMDIESHDASDLHPPTTDLFPKYLLPFLAGHLGRSPILSTSALIENLQMQR